VLLETSTNEREMAVIVTWY